MKNLYKNSFEKIKISNNFEEKVIENCENNKKAKIRKFISKKVVSVTAAIALTASLAGFTVTAANGDFAKQLYDLFSSESTESSEYGEKSENYYKLIEPYTTPLDMSYDAKNANISLNGYVSDGAVLYVLGSVTVFDESFEFNEDMFISPDVFIDQTGNATEISGAVDSSIDDEQKNKMYFVVATVCNTVADFSDITVKFTGIYERQPDSNNVDYVLSIWHEFKNCNFSSNAELLSLTDNNDVIKLDSSLKIPGYDVYKEYSDIKISALGVKYTVNDYPKFNSDKELSKFWTLRVEAENGVGFDFDAVSKTTLGENLKAVMKDGSVVDVSPLKFYDSEQTKIKPVLLDVSQIDYLEHTDDVNGTIKIDVAGKYAEKYSETTEQVSDTETSSTETTETTQLKSDTQDTNNTEDTTISDVLENTETTEY